MYILKLLESAANLITKNNHGLSNCTLFIDFTPPAMMVSMNLKLCTAVGGEELNFRIYRTDLFGFNGAVCVACSREFPNAHVPCTLSVGSSQKCFTVVVACFSLSPSLSLSFSLAHSLA